MKKITLLLLTIFTYVGIYAQGVLTIEEMNTVYKKEKHHEKKVQPYAPLRQADVMWSRKIWREIDLRQKINHPFYYPDNDGEKSITSDRKSLIDVIYSAVKGGELTAYGNAVLDDEFRNEMTQEEFSSIGGAKEELLEVRDWESDDPFATKMEVNKVPFNRNQVKKWRLKEVWFFDKQRSVMDVRIVGIAPLTDRNSEGDITGSYNPLFWVYFNEARETLINAEVFNLVKNDAERRTYDDIFWKRMFSSTIVKEANVMDRNVNEYMIGLDALLEAERIKVEIFNIEHDLWEY
jgi:gliding motility associated protien GldN